MTNLRIVCTQQVPYGNPPCKARIIATGASNGGDYWELRLTVEEMYELYKQNYNFYTKGLESGKIASVQFYWCSSCRKVHIRSSPDAVKDNNLDFLGYCLWKSAA